MKNLLSLSVADPNGDSMIPISPPGGIPSGGLKADGTGSFNDILRSGIIALLVVAALLSLAYLIWGGIGWITSGGDKTKVQAARNKMVYAIIGLIVSFLAFMIVSFIGKLFGVTLF